MISQPSFVYDKFRKGTVTDEQSPLWKIQSHVWNNQRTVLEGIIRTEVEIARASLVRLFSNEDEHLREIPGVTGDPEIYYLTRNEPPLSPEEAIEIGGTIVQKWQDAQVGRDIPTYCDQVFILPSNS